MDNKVLENYITEMSIALEDEIKALKEGEGGKKVNLIEGQFIYKIGEKYIYKFIIDTELVYIEDTPAQMIIPGGKGKEDKYQVVINNIDANEISLALNENLGNYISEAILIIAPYYLLEILRDKLQEIKDNKIEINDKLLNNLFIEHTSSIINIIEDLEQGDLNRQQYEALKYSMERDITFIWGPPGTGKTYTIGHIIYNFIKQGKKVLIASHTNSAIDTALIKVADVIEDENLLEGGKIIRIGTPHKENSKLKKMLLDNIINDKAQILGLEKDKLEDESKSIEIILNKLNETVNFFNNLEEKLVNYQEVGEKIKNNEELFNHYIALIKETEIQLKNERENLISIEKANVIVRLFRRSAEEIKRDINRYEQKIENTGKLLKNIERDLAKDNIRKNELENEIQFLKNRIKENVGDRSKNEIIQEVNILIDKYERLNEKISEVNKKIEKIRCEIIEESLVIGTTLTKTFLEEDIYKNKYDAVIIDESSMAPLPNIFFTSGLAKNHLILSGDFRQLAPIAVAETDMVNKWLK